jgi:hypothetical protein
MCQISACGQEGEFCHSPGLRRRLWPFSPEIRKAFLAIFGAAWFPHEIISLLIGAVDVVLMLVAVIPVADAIGIRCLDKRLAGTARRSCARWRARRR